MAYLMLIPHAVGNRHVRETDERCGVITRWNSRPRKLTNVDWSRNSSREPLLVFIQLHCAAVDQFESLSCRAVISRPF